MKDNAATLLSNVWKDFEVELPLIKSCGEEKQLNTTAKTQDEVYLDVEESYMWIGQRAFFMSGCSIKILCNQQKRAKT